MLLLQALLLQSTSVIRARMFCCSSTTSSASLRQVLRFPHFLVVCLPQLVTSQPWLQRWASFRSVLLPPRKVLLLPYRQFTSLQTTLLTLLLLQPLRTWMQLPFFLVLLPSLVFTQQLTLWPAPVLLLIHPLLVQSTTALLWQFRRPCRSTPTSGHHCNSGYGRAF